MKVYDVWGLGAPGNSDCTAIVICNEGETIEEALKNKFDFKNLDFSNLGYREININTVKIIDLNVGELKKILNIKEDIKNLSILCLDCENIMIPSGINFTGMRLYWCDKCKKEYVFR